MLYNIIVYRIMSIKINNNIKNTLFSIYKSLKINLFLLLFNNILIKIKIHKSNKNFSYFPIANRINLH